MKACFPMTCGLLGVCCLGPLAFAQVDESQDIKEQLQSRLQTMEHIPTRFAELYLDRVMQPAPSPTRSPYLDGTPYSGYRALFPYLGVEAFQQDASGQMQHLPLTEDEIARAAKLRGQARRAFRAGNYAQAVQFAAESNVIEHDSAETYELLSLAMFALKDYRGAATEAHAAMYFGDSSYWPALPRRYSFTNRQQYEAQFQELKSQASNQPKSAHTVFLLAYHYFMQGHLERAKMTLRDAIALAPRDALAKRLLARLESEPTARADAPSPPRPDRS